MKHTQGEQRRRVSVVMFSCVFRLNYFCFLVAMTVEVHDMETYVNC